MEENKDELEDKIRTFCEEERARVEKRRVRSADGILKREIMEVVNQLLFEKADKDDILKTNENKCDKLDAENIIQL